MAEDNTSSSQKSRTPGTSGGTATPEALADEKTGSTTPTGGGESALKPESEKQAGLCRLLPHRPAFWLVAAALLISILVGQFANPTWTTQRISLETQQDAQNQPYIERDGERQYLDDAVPYDQSPLHPDQLAELEAGETPELQEQVVAQQTTEAGETSTNYYRLIAASHWGPWSLLPAIVAIGCCLLTREPLVSLLMGVVTGALLLGNFDVVDQVILPSLATENAAGVLLLYLWLLGALMGIWSKTGGAQAFAEAMARHVVRGPKTAKLVAWAMGVIFFQGGTMSTVLVGTAVRPVADKERISHEELSYIVDSTASPIAAVLAFNAWPAYVQGLIFVPGVAFLATESDRLSFFFQSVPLSFYGIFAVLGTFLLSVDKAPFVGKRLKKAIQRARTTGELDAPGAKPMTAKELNETTVPEGYQPSVLEFAIPLAGLIGVAIGTFLLTGSPQVRWAFASAVVLAAAIAAIRGMGLLDLMDGVGQGLKGVVVASVILMLAITIGGVSEDTGGGLYLVDQLGQSVPYWALPVLLQLLTIVIAFSTGTSFGTYAVTFPLAMPLAWAVAQSPDVSRPELLMMVCFAAILNGSIYGDQCSPISDTTILSSTTTGADLMDHVRTQLPPATLAALLAAICWTVVAVLFV